MALLEDLLDDIDVVLIMSVNPGFGGQKFIPRALEKIRQARALIDRNGASCKIEVDGGITLENARSVAQAGADVLVVGSAIFETPDCSAATREFEKVLAGAAAR